MIRVLIVDDEPPARRKVRRFLELDAEIGAIGEAGSGVEAIDAIRTFAPDLVFLDVQMPDMDGFTVLRAVPEPHEFHVIFLTAHHHHALRAFEAEALDYLLKPADPERFERALERAKEQVALRRERGPKSEPARFLKRILVEKTAGKSFCRWSVWIGRNPTAITFYSTRAAKSIPSAKRWRSLPGSSTPSSSRASAVRSWSISTASRRCSPGSTANGASCCATAAS